MNYSFSHRIVIVLALLLAPLHAGAQTRIRLMAANTTSGNFQAYEAPGIRIFQGIQPDIVMIQEFNYRSGTLRDLVNTAFGTEFQFFVESGSEIPNGVVSRYPIIASGEWADTEANNRDFAWARIDIPGDKDLWVVSVHLLTANATTRNREAIELRDHIQANVPATDYLAIGGDFNTNSFSESAFNTLSGLVNVNSPYPADQNGNIDTNAGRNSPYDTVLVSSNLHALRTAVVIGANSHTNGLVFDSRVYTPLSAVSPVQQGDSGVSGMQHMGVLKDFLIPTSTSTPTATPTPGTPTPSPTPGTTTPTPTPGTPTPSPTPGGPGTGEVFINEIHYDDLGTTDSDEGAEVAGPAGTNLSGWRLVAYNGSATQRNVYADVALTGTLPDQGGCFGTAWFPIAGLQNGAPDGLALVNPAGQAVQFLSWEGTFIAADGPAAGMTSVAIGAEETGTTPVGHSLQLAGTGNRAADFTWQPAQPNTRNQPNTGQTFAGCQATPTPTPSPAPTASPTPSPTPTASPSPSPTSSPSPTPSPTPEPTPEPTPLPTASPTPAPTATPEPTPTLQPTAAFTGMVLY